MSQLTEPSIRFHASNVKVVPIVAPLLVGVAFLGLWQMAVSVWKVDPYILPSPSAIGEQVSTARTQILDGMIGTGRNEREATHDPTAHAEVVAIREAAAHLGTWRLDGATLAVTLEPCPMCAGAAWLSRVDRVVFGAWNEEYGAAGSLWDVLRDGRLNHRPEVVASVLADECAALLSDFFASRRTGS